MIGIRYLTKADVDELGLIEILQVLALCKTRKSKQLIRLVDSETEEVTVLSPQAIQLLHDFLQNIMYGKVNTTIPHHAELSAEQAADILGVPRKYLIEILKSGEMPYSKHGMFYYVRMEDLMTYKEETNHKRAAALDELVALSQGLGLYD